MTILTIEIPDKVEKSLSDFVEQLGGKIIATTEKKSGKAEKKQQILTDLEESIRWVKLYQESKVKEKPIRELLDEL